MLENEFIEAINALKKQNDLDRDYSNRIEQLIAAENVPSYNNSALINYIISTLQKKFVPVNGDCEIERYCFELNFGYKDGKQSITPSDLWYALVNKQTLFIPD